MIIRCFGHTRASAKMCKGWYILVHAFGHWCKIFLYFYIIRHCMYMVQEHQCALTTIMCDNLHRCTFSRHYLSMSNGHLCPVWNKEAFLMEEYPTISMLAWIHFSRMDDSAFQERVFSTAASAQSDRQSSTSLEWIMTRAQNHAPVHST